MSFREEDFKSWDHVVSDEFVYLAHPLKRNHKRIDPNWITEYYNGRSWLELKITLVGQRTSYFKAICSSLPTNRDRKLIRNVGILEGDESVLVGITKLVQLPEEITLKRCPVLIRLKRFDDLDGVTGNVLSLTGKPLLRSLGELSLNGKLSVRRRIVLGEKGKIPSKMVKTGTQTVSKFSGKEANRIRSDVLFKPNEVNSMLRVVFFADGIGVVPQKPVNFSYELIEVRVCPTKFYLRVRQPGLHCSL